MFNETDPDLEEKATGARLLAIWAAAIVATWSVVIAAYFFITRVALPAAETLWSVFQ